MGELGALWEIPVMRMHFAGRDVAAETADEDEEEAPGEEHADPTAAAVAAAALESSL